MEAEPSFLCTFCWTPWSPPAKPKVLGREARIACETCWKGVLNLSICWVCGEIVVRGEEVISLGWCFWHRACFGCLLCGTSLNPPMKNEHDGEGFHWIDKDDSDDKDDSHSGYIDAWGNQRQRGVELVNIPLCPWCDNATDGLYNARILEMGLQNVTKKDGGLSKSRLDMQKEVKSNDTAPLGQKTMTLTKEQMQFHNIKRELEARTNLLAGTGDLGVREGGNADRMSNYNGSAESMSPLPALVYVSVLDTIGEPSFRASRTKPLPGWMTLLPSNRQPAFEQYGITTLFGETPISAHGLKSTIGEKLPDSRTPLETDGTVSDQHSHKGMKRIGNTGADTIVGLKREHATICEPVILIDTKDGIADDKDSSNYEVTRPERSGTPYLFRKAIHRHPITRFPCQEAVTNIAPGQLRSNGGLFATISSPVASPLLPRDGRLKKQDISIKEEPNVGRFKRQKIKGSVSSGGEWKETCPATQHDEPENSDRGDQLRRGLFSLFDVGREPAQER